MLGQVVEQGEDRFVAEWTDADGLELRTTFPTERQAVEHVARHGGPALRVHDLRHSYATWLVSNNVPINDAQRVMGHEQASTLLDLYTHASQDRDERLRDLAASDTLPEDPAEHSGEEEAEPGDGL
jgi:hypothetical protein